jgi:DNA-binding SARP family transcriptional activator
MFLGGTMDNGRAGHQGSLPSSTGSRPASLSIRLLGSFQVSVTDRLVEPHAWRLRKATHLVKILALAPGHRLHRDQVIDALWPEIDPDSALSSFHQALHAARRALEPDRSARASGSLLRLHQQVLSFEPADAVWVDAEAFQAAVLVARSSPDLDAHLAAQALYTGDLLPEDLYESWTQRARDSLHEMFLDLLLNTARLQEERGASADAIETLRRLIDTDPLNEPAHAALMRLYAGSGRRDQALRIYQQLSERLRAELDAEPSPEVSRFHQRISAGDLVHTMVVTPKPPARPKPSVQAQPERDGGSRISLVQFAREDGVFNRRPELDYLQRAFDALHADRGQIVLLAGEPGIGKTRLAETLAHFANLNGATVLWARCHEAVGTPAFWPWLQIVRSSLRANPTDVVTADLGMGAGPIAQVVPEIRALLPDIPAPPELDPDQARFRFFESVTSFLVRLSERHPLVLILDDLHWADRSSLMLLEFLGDEIEAQRIMLIGMYRDADAASNVALIRALERLNRSRATQRLMLSGFEIQDTAQYGAFIAGRPLPENLVQTIYERTDGNPFFLREVVQLLAAEGDEGDPSDLGRWGTTVPLGVREAVTLRLSRLSDDARRVLVDAAVIGSEFELALLSTVSDLAIDRILDLLEEAISLGVIAEDNNWPERFRFTHVLVRQTLYESLIVARRARIHARIGSALEEISASSVDPPYAELAHHFSLAAAAGEAERAVKYLTAAGEQSMARIAYAEAVDQFRHALEILDRFMPERQVGQFDLLLMLARAALATGESDDAHIQCLRAVDVARSIGDPERLALAALEVVDFTSSITEWRASDEIALLEEALAALPPGVHPLRARLMSRLAYLLVYDKTRPDSLAVHSYREQLARDAVAMARLIGRPEIIVDALRSAHDALWTYEDVDERLVIAREQLSLAMETDDPRMQLSTRAQLIGHFLIKGLIDEVDQQLDAYEVLAMRYHLDFNLWSVTAKRAMRAFMRGELVESEQLMDRARAIGLRPNPEVSRFTMLIQLFVLRREQDRRQEIEEIISAEALNHPTEPFWQCLMAVLHADAERRDEVAQIMAGLLDAGPDALSRDSYWLASQALVADASASVGDTRHAAALLASLTPYSRQFVSPGNNMIFLGPLSHYLGRLSDTLERWGDAASYYEAALAAEKRVRIPIFEGHTEYAYAGMLTRRGDRSTASLHLDRALGIAERFSLARLHRQAVALREQPAACHSP